MLLYLIVRIGSKYISDIRSWASESNSSIQKMDEFEDCSENPHYMLNSSPLWIFKTFKIYIVKREKQIYF